MTTDTVPAAVPGPDGPPAAGPSAGPVTSMLASLMAPVDPARPTFDITPPAGAATATGQAGDTPIPGGSSAAYHGDNDTSGTGTSDTTSSRIEKKGIWRAWLLAGAARWGKGGGALNKRLDVAKAKAQSRQVKEARTVTMNRSGGLAPRNSAATGPGGKSLNSKGNHGSSGKGAGKSNGNGHGPAGHSGNAGHGGSGPGRGGGGGRGSSGASGNSNGGGRSGGGGAAKAPAAAPKPANDHTPKNGGTGTGGTGTSGAKGAEGSAGKDGRGGGAGSSGGSAGGSSTAGTKPSASSGGSTTGKDTAGRDGHTGKDTQGAGSSGSKGATGAPGTPGKAGGSGSGGAAGSRGASGSGGHAAPTAHHAAKTPMQKTREAGYHDGALVAGAAAHVKAYGAGVKDGWSDRTEHAKREQARLDKAHADRKQQRDHDRATRDKKEQPVGSSADFHKPEPIPATVDGNTVHLGEGAARDSLTRGEVRTLKSFERLLDDKTGRLNKFADMTKGLKAHAAEQEKRATTVLEQAKASEAGEKVIGTLVRLRDDAKAQVAKAEELHTRAERGRDGCTVLLTNVETRYGDMYKAVVNSPETTPAETSFYLGDHSA
ncbi:hypothetical protein [Streptomyces xanthochromogenes]